MTRTEEIEERLKNATSGPWEAYKPSSHYYIRADGQYLTGYSGSFRKADALLIANAPSDLEHLLAENKHLREALEFFISVFDHKGKNTPTIGHALDVARNTLECDWPAMTLESIK